MPSSASVTDLVPTRRLNQEEREEETKQLMDGFALTKKEGERKFSMNQNLTVLLVCFMTEMHMM